LPAGWNSGRLGKAVVLQAVGRRINAIHYYPKLLSGLVFNPLKAH
jgi:hypothetical protein